MTAKKNNDEKKYLVLATEHSNRFVTAGDNDLLTPYTKAGAEEAIESLLVDHYEDAIFIDEVSKECSCKRTISIKEIE